jgi:hypothetical protein
MCKLLYTFLNRICGLTFSDALIPSATEEAKFSHLLFCRWIVSPIVAHKSKQQNETQIERGAKENCSTL